jgi:Dyp-type peroxidase family
VARLDWGDVQGTILRGYRVDLARHLVLKVEDAARARSLLGAVVGGDPSLPQITTAARWQEKPDSFLNVGITYPGLAALGVPAESLASFPRAFRRGATDPKTAELVGDVGASDPSQWIGGLSRGADVHVILSIWVPKERTVLDEVTATLRAAFAGAATELSCHDTDALPGDLVHFGYRDSIAQPLVEGAPPMKRPAPDGQEVVPTGAFLLGHLNQNGGIHRVQPGALSTNSSFAAFRILEQDVSGFEAFLTAGAATLGIDRELLAAKVCGRWRNGVPLALAPDTEAPTLPNEAMNDFDYVRPGTDLDDPFGYRCPLGSHVRRTNPRGQDVVGGGGHLHRIIRRGMPYGPKYDPGRPDDLPRGLIGFFINADLGNQFEFIMSSWMNGPDFVKSFAGPDGINAVKNISGADVLGGVNDPSSSSFTIPFPPTATEPARNERLTGFSRFVTTRGGAYCYLPSITALHHLAALPR